MRRTILVSLFSVAFASWGAGQETEARVSVDVKDAPIEAIAGLLIELGGRQVVYDPGLNCALTLKLHEVPWLTALDTTLRACGLGYQDEAGVLWVATTARLREEAQSRGRQEEPPSSGERGLAFYHLSYARAEKLAPLLMRFVSPGGDVTLDPRTNTLIIRY